MGTKSGTGTTRRRRGRNDTKNATDRHDVPTGLDDEFTDAEYARAIQLTLDRFPRILDLIAPDRSSDATGLPLPLANHMWITHNAQRYAETRNPVFAWEALNVAFGHGLPIPDWVLAYLRRVAARMHALSRTDIPHDALPPAIHKALEFPPVRGANPFRTITDTAHDLHITLDVLSLIQSGHKLDLALDFAAERHPARCARQPPCQSISRSTVMRIFKQHADTLQRGDPNVAGELNVKRRR